MEAPNMPEAKGCEGRRQLMLAIYAAFPDICYTIQDLIAEGDKVVAHWSATGTHKGELCLLKTPCSLKMLSLRFGAANVIEHA
jgi:predicted ester cyclase